MTRLKHVTLAQLLKQAGISQVKLAEKLGITQPSVSELVHSKDPSLSSLLKVVKALGGELELRVRLGDDEFILVGRETVDYEARAEREALDARGRPRMREALGQVLGAGAMTVDEILAALVGQGWISATDIPRQHLLLVLRQRAYFERVEGGRFRVRKAGSEGSWRVRVPRRIVNLRRLDNW